MLPWGHFVVAAGPVAAYTLLKKRQWPTPKHWFVIVVGSQFPDLIDKPLAHLLFVLPSGRVGLHSIPVFVPLAIVVLYGDWEFDRLRAGVVFVFAWATHILADTYRILLRPNTPIPPDLLWPFAEPVLRPVEPCWAGPNGINVNLWTVFSVILLSIAVFRLVGVYREEHSSSPRPPFGNG